MNPEAKVAWIAALRSGDYPQSSGYLKNYLGYCCLGVLCDVAKRMGAIEVYTPSDSVLPPTVVTWADLDTPNPFTSLGCLAEVNDTKKLTFFQIADLIESEL